jgi:hypothetical protein
MAGILGWVGSTSLGRATAAPPAWSAQVIDTSPGGARRHERRPVALPAHLDPRHRFAGPAAPLRSRHAPSPGLDDVIIGLGRGPIRCGNEDANEPPSGLNAVLGLSSLEVGGYSAFVQMLRPLRALSPTRYRGAGRQTAATFAAGPL